VELLILANSRKLGGRCIAGIDLESKKWVRPVSRSDHGALRKDECLILDGSIWRDLAVLDVVSAPIGIAIDALGQPENRVLLSDAWSLKGNFGKDIERKITTELLDVFCDEEKYLIYGNGRSVQMRSVKSNLVKKSLILIKSLDPQFYNEDGTMKLRCKFKHAGEIYDLPITDDSDWVAQAKHNPKAFSRGVWYFTVSLGEPYKGQMWKLIASGISFQHTIRVT